MSGGEIVRYLTFLCFSLLLGWFAAQGFWASVAALAVWIFGYGVNLICCAIEERR
jgi:hypothetical protein